MTIVVARSIATKINACCNGTQKRPGVGSPEKPRKAQKSPEKPRKAQRSPEKPRKAQKSPEKPRKAQKSPEKPRKAQEKRQKSPEKPITVSRACLEPKPVGSGYYINNENRPCGPVAVATSPDHSSSHGVKSTC